jgi:shikimate kinase/3-dehydroquinate synthase
MRTIVLSGFMATGKSTTGKLLAARLGLPFVDTDEAIASAAGLSIPELWRTEGEAAFRSREREIVRPLLTDGVARVLSFGGGTVTSKELRHLALERALLVTLSARPETIVARAGDRSLRPNLNVGDPIQRAEHLLEIRAEAYAECHETFATDDLEPDQLVDRIITLAERDPIAVPLGSRSYVVDVGFNRSDLLTDAIARLAPTSLMVVTDAHVERARGKVLAAALDALTLNAARVTLPPGEEHKTLVSVGTLWDAALGAGIDRSGALLAFGGGVVGDLTGFAASTLLRGVDFVQVPTTLLSMVDASVGGKTAFDHPVGKNLIGTFHQPRAVIVDLAHLETLSDRDVACGMAEVVKIALAADGPLLEALEALSPSGSRLPRADLVPLVRAAILAKVRIVRDDEREAGPRVLLNLGHTLGHAIEAYGHFSRWRHGEAVAIGTMLELEATAKMGATPKEMLARARDLFARFGLPTSVTPNELSHAWPFVGSDKKRRGTKVRLPLVTGPGQAKIEDVPLSSLRTAAGLDA